MHPMQQRSTYCNRNRLCSRYAIDAVHEVVKVEQPNNEKHSDRNAQQPHLQLQTEQRQSGKATDPPQSQDSSKQVNLVLALGLVLGVMLGLFAALLRAMYLQRKTVAVLRMRPETYVIAATAANQAQPR